MDNTYWEVIWGQYKKSKTGLIALIILAIFCFIGLYAPLFASNKPLLVIWNHHIYFPLLRYLFYTGFYTKPIDLFFNLLMLTLPLACLSLFLVHKLTSRLRLLAIFGVLHCVGFIYLASGVIKDPSFDPHLENMRKKAAKSHLLTDEDPLLASFPLQASWELDLRYLNNYDQLNQLLDYHQIMRQHERLTPYLARFTEKTGREMPTLWHVSQRHEEAKRARLQASIQALEGKYQEAQKILPTLAAVYLPFSHAFMMAKYALEHAPSQQQPDLANQLDIIIKEAQMARLTLENVRQDIINYQKAVGESTYLKDKERWLKEQSGKMHIVIPPLARAFHWEQDAGGAQTANQYLPWWELTRINRKDLIASLIFGIRVSVVVGISAIAIALSIGIPLGLLAGYFAGITDLIICRIIEMWEAMPTFFMLLLIIAITQSKSIFLVISVLGIFGWTGIARFIRSEVFKQRNLSYVTACQSLGYTHKRIMFSHILPNAIPPIITLLPFSIMGAITSEAGLSFLGLGEEGSTSWGVLMDEGRSVFPAESYLLWPPATLLTILLISIALVGDRLRDAIDPKMR
jgi:peptide/nickel transport system permease protein